VRMPVADTTYRGRSVRAFLEGPAPGEPQHPIAMGHPTAASTPTTPSACWRTWVGTAPGAPSSSVHPTRSMRSAPEPGSSRPSTRPA
jgi:hypothetical protein